MGFLGVKNISIGEVLGRTRHAARCCAAGIDKICWEISVLCQINFYLPYVFHHFIIIFISNHKIHRSWMDLQKIHC